MKYRIIAEFNADDPKVANSVKDDIESVLRIIEKHNHNFEIRRLQIQEKTIL